MTETPLAGKSASAGMRLKKPFWHDDALMSRWFRRIWFAALGLTALSLGKNLGLGNINPVERTLLLLAAALFVIGRPVRPATFIGLTVMALAALGAGAMTNFPLFEWTRSLMAIGAFITMMSFLVVRPREEDAKLILLSIAWLPVILVALGLVFYVLLGRPLMMRDHTGAMRLGGAVIPAFLAGACYSASIAGGFLYCRQQTWRNLALIIFSLLTCALSGSRMPTACALVSVALCIGLSPQTGFVRVLVLIYGAALLTIFLLTLGDQLVARFQSASNSGRDLMWSSLESVARRYPLFGIGYGHHGLMIPDSVSRITGTVASHNEFLRLRVELGWIGTSVFGLGWAVFWLSRFSRFVMPSLIYTALVTIFCVISYTDNTLFATFDMLAILAIGLGIVPVVDDYIMRSRGAGDLSEPSKNPLATNRLGI